MRLFLALSVILALATACGEEEIVCTEPLRGGPFADSPDAVVRLLVEEVWPLELRQDASRRRHVLDNLLGEDYAFEFFSLDVDTSRVFAAWARRQELAAYENLARGEPGVFPSGDLRNGLVTTDSLRLNPLDASGWQPVSSGPYAGAWTQSYQLVPWEVRYEDQPQDIDTIVGCQDFYVAPETIALGCGDTVTAWRLVAWVDRGFPCLQSKRRHRVFTWGYLRAIYGPKPPAG